MRKPSQPMWYSIVALIIGLTAVTLTGIQYTRYATEKSIRQSEQKWCAIVVLLDDAYRSSPQVDPVRKKLASKMYVLRQEFRCEPRGV